METALSNMIIYPRAAAKRMPFARVVSKSSYRASHLTICIVGEQRPTHICEIAAARKRILMASDSSESVYR